MNSQPFKGMVFYHSRVRDPNNNMLPMVYKVTKVEYGHVFYRPVDSKKTKEYTTLKDFDRICLWVKNEKV